MEDAISMNRMGAGGAVHARLRRALVCVVTTGCAVKTHRARTPVVSHEVGTHASVQARMGAALVNVDRAVLVAWGIGVAEWTIAGEIIESIDACAGVARRRQAIVHVGVA